MLSQFLSANVIEPFGWALVHSVWQLAAVGILFALAMATPLFRTPNWRYAAGVLAMAFMVAAPLATFWFLSAKVEGDVSTNAQRHVVDGTPVGSPGTVPFAEGDHALMAHLESTSLAAEALGRTREGNLASAPRRADSWKALAVSRIRPALPWLVRFWCVGVLLVSFWNVGGWLLLRRLRRSGTRAVSPDLIDLLDGLATRLRVSRPVTLLESALVHIPSVVGWLRPAILMPVGVIGGLPMDQLEAILAHELAHIRRHDYLVNLLQGVAETFFFYHPAVWRVSCRIRLERESCADEAAVSICGSRIVYAKTLAALEEHCHRPPHLAVAVGGSSLRRRIERILGVSRGERSRYRSWLAGTVGALAMLAAMLVTTLSQPAATAETDPRPGVENRAVEAPAEPGVPPQHAVPEESVARQKSRTFEQRSLQRSEVPEGVMERAIGFLRRAQNEDGTWNISDQYPVGATSLCTLALLKSGVEADDAQIQRALSYLRSAEPDKTYELSLQTLVFCAANPGADRMRIQRNVEWLEQGQVARGSNAGGWSYQSRDELGTGADGSNSEFAVWALDEAVHAGAKVKQETWQRALDYWRQHQNEDGSWGYTGSSSRGTGSMTCSGIVSIALCAKRLAAGDDSPVPEQDIAVSRGLSWLEQHFAVGHNPGGGSWLLYYLMVLRRVGDVTGKNHIGDHDWYGKGVKFLAERQSTRTGAWSGVGGVESSPLIGSSFALLFLTPVQTTRIGDQRSEVVPSVALTGRVVDERGKAIVGVRVSAAMSQAIEESTELTGRNGEFTVRLPSDESPRRYHVFFPGYGSSDALVVQDEPLVIKAWRDRALIQGIWNVVTKEEGGRELPRSSISDLRLFISRNRLRIWDGDDLVTECVFEIDASKVPQTINLTDGGGTTRGIYHLDGDDLRIGLNRTGDKRPSRFASRTEPDSDMVMILERRDAKEDVAKLRFPSSRDHERICAALLEKVEVEFSRHPLSEVLDFLGEVHGIRVVLDPEVLSDSRLRDAPVTLAAKTVRLHTALTMVLKPLKLTYEVRDGAVVIRAVATAR